LVSNDPILTELGLAQAARLCDRRWGRVDELWVSPMRRARQTAEPLARLLGIEPIVHDWMAEIRPADEWDGSPIDELEHVFDNMNLRPVDELWDGMPGQESFRDFHRRVTLSLESEVAAAGLGALDGETGLWTADCDRTVVFVAHGGTNAVAIGYLLGAEPKPWEWDRFDSAHTSVATLTTRPIAHGTAFGMIGFGDVTHLDPDMVTR
jgi:broad specificity phosphatase PhoE